MNPQEANAVVDLATCVTGGILLVAIAPIALFVFRVVFRVILRRTSLPPAWDLATGVEINNDIWTTLPGD